ncbi:MAG: thiamine phosphate synthase [Candidatus Omnitrophica bacterium]|nr:thiamine phosphate synthase [Candidatus Omnitrophota bacterium]
MESPLDRTLDACLNRASEGLRVLMDVARFELDHRELSESLKGLRHRLIQIFQSDLPSASELLHARRSEQDVSRPSDSSKTPPAYGDLAALVQANSRRAEEALRTLEEFSRLTDSTRARAVEHLRYECYDLHRKIALVAQEQSIRGKMDFELYVVTDEKLSMGRGLTEVVTQAIRGGAGCIQLREKRQDKKTVLAQAKEVRKITRDEGVTFIVNDHLDIALEVGADGVHVGQEDLPLSAARRLSRGSLLIGVSTHNREQALEAQEGGAGYVNIGPIFQTQTKGVPVHPVGPDLIREMKPILTAPFTIMGGIHLDNVEEVILAGADRVAVVSEVVAAEDIEGAARGMVEAIARAKEKRETIAQESSD